MSMQDPIADMLTCIRNSQNANKMFVSFFYSKIKKSIIRVLHNEGYIKDFLIEKKENNKLIKIHLKYFRKKPVIQQIKRVSKPGLRIYKTANKLPKIMNGLGIAIISTSQGVMTDSSARKINIGGEIICYIS